MYFNKLFGYAETPEGIETTIHRTAVRAVIVRNGKILLVQSDSGTYELPGGGVEEKESFTAALLREVKEETGYINCVVKRKIGVITENRLDQFLAGTSFQMVSHYYFCELADDKKMADFQWGKGFAAKWMDIDQAIRENHISMVNDGNQPFLHRENFVLGEINRLFL